MNETRKAELMKTVESHLSTEEVEAGWHICPNDNHSLVRGNNRCECVLFRPGIWRRIKDFFFSFGDNGCPVGWY